MCSSTFDAENSPARICESESRMAELLDHDPISLENLHQLTKAVRIVAFVTQS